MDPARSLRHRHRERVVLLKQLPVARDRLTEAITPAAQPLIRPASRSAMVFPLVVLIAVLPGMVALNSWDLTPPGPLWGIRGLVILNGHVFDQIHAADEIKPLAESARFEQWPFSLRFMHGLRHLDSG